MPGLKPWEPLAWDSGFFGFGTARILARRADARTLEAILSDLDAQGMRLAYWAVDPADAGSREAAAACGGFLAAEKVTWLADPIRLHPVSPGSVPSAVPACNRGWDEALLALSVRAGTYSRFRVDPRFPPALFRSLYEEWMRKSLSGEMADAVLAIPSGGRPAGMISVSARDGVGTIGLVAVEADQEGRGLGSALVQAAAAWFLARGCVKSQVVTQGANTPACALYAKNGYRPEKRELIYHFWF